MKRNGSLYFALCAAAGLLLTGCPREPKIDPALNLLDPTNKSENEITVHWKVIEATPAETHLELCCAPDFIDIFESATLYDPGQTSHHFTGLHGATKYYYRIRIITSDDVELLEAGEFRTGYQSEKADVITSDGLCIAGDLYYLSTNPAGSPAMILMGHFSISNMWKGEDLVLDLVARGYVCYIFSYRGHPGSCDWNIKPPEEEWVAWLAQFIEEYASKDLDACYDHLKSHPLVDSTRIGLMGGSLGANMSMFANNWPGIKVSVGLSTSRLGLANVGILSNALFIASELDCIEDYVYFADDAWHLYNHAAAPKEIIIIPGKFHGMDMLVEPTLSGHILDWIDARMTD